MKNILYSLLIICLSSCNNTVHEAPSMDGTWKSLGYGQIVKIVAGSYMLAEVTDISCIPLMDGEVSDFGEALQLKNDTLRLKDGINRYYFTKIEDAPAVCKKGTKEHKEAQSKATDPEYNFEVLWNTFKDHYAYFDLRGVNPTQMYSQYRPKITKTTTQAQLFFILNEMLESFEDGHIGIDAPQEIEDAAQQLYLAKHQEEDTGEVETEKTKEKLRNYQVAKMVAQKYIPERTDLRNGNVRWGTLEGNIGYLQLNQMMGLADYGISDTLSYRDYWMAYFEKLESVEDDNSDELAAINNILDQVMQDLAQTNALIIDVRFNGGGKDEVGMAVLERLNNKERIVFTKKAKLGNGFTPKVSVVQARSQNPYSQPVYLLIATESASATEIMALSSLSLPNITRIGSHTEGVFSDMLDKVLPNQWEFSLSNEIYESMDGKSFEEIGIPPTYEIGYPRNTQKFLHKVKLDLEEAGDLSINKAIELINN